jgi:hypothetical protein
METALDEYDYQKWYIESFTYKGNVLILDLARVQIKGDQNISPRYVVIFDDVKYFQAYDETSHLPEEIESRVKGVIAEHVDSSLMNYLKEHTTVLDGPGNFKHYSVMTGDEFVHVVTRSEPKVARAS